MTTKVSLKSMLSVSFNYESLGVLTIVLLLWFQQVQRSSLDEGGNHPYPQAHIALPSRFCFTVMGLPSTEQPLLTGPARVR